MIFVTTLLALHIVAGIVCLFVGVVSFSVKKKKGTHTIFGEVYHACYVVIFLTAVVLALLNWEESAVLFFVAIFSYAFALIGYLAKKRHWKKWINLHIGGMLGSYIGVITAVLITNGQDIPLLNRLPMWVLLILPTIIGTPASFYVRKRFHRQKKTKTAVS